MGTITNFLEDELLDHVFNAAYTPAASVWLSLYESDPADDDSGSETAYTNYARQECAYDAAASRSVVQTATETFPSNGGGTVTVTHWGVHTAVTAGSLLAHGAFASSKQVNSGNTPSVAAAETDVTFSAGEVSDYLADNLLDFAFRNQAFTGPATWVGLVTVVAADDDTGTTITEPANNYSRVQVNINGGSSPTWDLSSSSLVDNTHLIQMPTPSGTWGTVVGVVIVDASTVGNLLCYDNTLTDELIGTDDDIEFPVGTLDITLD